MIEVLYEDNHVIAVVKPAGLLIESDINNDRCLLEDVRAYLKEKYQKPGNVFVGLIHRLDRNVSGIVVFAKTSKGASRLSAQFREHSIKKIYHALVEGIVEPESGTLKSKLEKDERKMMAYASETGKDAILDYQVVYEKGGNTLVEIILKTGRFHQIRFQFAEIGHPVIGDIKYGSSLALSNGTLALAATRLEFKKAVGGEKVILEIPIPEWK